MTRLRPSFGYALALAAEVAAFHRRVLFQPGYLFPWDFRGVHLPLASFIADSLRHGRMPLWEPYSYCGNPIFANIQAALFYPPVLAATAASNWLGGLPRLLALAVCLQIFFAGLSTFALLRRLDARPGAAFLAATAYQLGCFFAAQAEHMGAMQGAAWIPLVWLCVVELRAAWRWRWMAILSLALAMAVLAGLPQLAVAEFVSAALLALFAGRIGAALRVLAACFWAALLAAVQLIPTAQLTAFSVAKFRTEWLKTGGGIKPGAFFTLLWPDYWNVFDMAKFHGPADATFLYLYCGILTLGLALAAILWKPDGRARQFGLLTLAAALWMLGDSTPIGRAILAALPAVIRIGIHPEYTLPVFALGFAVLAGLGADRFVPPRWQTLAGAIVALDLLLVSSDRPFNAASVAAEAGTTHDALDGSADLASRLRALTGAATPPYRFDMAADVPLSWSIAGPILDIPTANGCDPLALERTIQLRLAFSPGERWGTCYQVVNPQSPVLNLANVRYLASKAPLPLPQVARIAGFTLSENVHVLARFFFVPRIQPATGLVDAARALHAASFDPAQAAIVEGPIAPRGFAPGEVHVLSYEPNEIHLETRAPGEAFLIAADSWYPGWQAEIDGRPAPIYIADVAFRGLRVPAGEHRIAMRFTPRILWVSAAISASALLAALWALTRRETGPNSPPESPA